MKQTLLMLHRLLRDEEGASVVEYGVLIALIIAAVIAVIAILGLQVEKGLNDFTKAYDKAKAGL
jgi:pilus assembly protein Flp/PilA